MMTFICAPLYCFGWPALGYIERSTIINKKANPEQGLQSFQPYTIKSGLENCREN